MFRVAATASRTARTNTRFFSSVPPLRKSVVDSAKEVSALSVLFLAVITQLTSHSQATRQADNSIAGAAVKGIEKAGEMAQKVKEATGLGTGEAQGKANEVSGTASGKANELAGKAEGKAAELEGKAKGAFEQAKAEADKP